MKRLAILIVLCVWFSGTAFGQGDEQKILVIKNNQEITVDGNLDEAIWNRAMDNPILIQRQLDRADPETVTTESKIIYDDNYIYIGILCFDAEPDKIMAVTDTKDADIRDDDSVFVLLESKLDSSNFFFFGLNFIGTQVDGKISKDGQVLDVGWNGVWQSASQKTGYGWSVEIALDRSNTLHNIRQLGLRFSRIVPRLDSSFKTGALDPAFEFDNLGQLGEIKFFLDQKRIQFTPYALSTTERFENYDFLGGLDLKYNFNQLSSAVITVNPDFATVEPDEDNFNLTPFEYYLPEKRPFFLQNTAAFEQPIRIFYSKRIGDIYGGLNINGKIGSFEITGISAQRKKNDLFGEDTANFSALRLQSPIGKTSSLGITAANKLTDNVLHGTLGADADIRLSQKIKLSGQFAYSYGDFQDGNMAFYLGPTYETTSFHLHLHYIQIGENFGENANFVGYVPDDNRREIDLGLEKSFEFVGGELNKIGYTSNYNIYWGLEGTLRSWQIDQGLSFHVSSGYVFSLYHTQEYMLNEYWTVPPEKTDPNSTDLFDSSHFLWDLRQRTFRETDNPYTFQYRNDYIDDLIVPLYYEMDSFRNHRSTLWSEFPSNTGSSFGLGITFGRLYGSGYHFLEMYKTFLFGQNSSIEYRLVSFRRMKKDGFPIPNTAIHIIKAKSDITDNIYTGLFFQVNHAIDKTNINWLVGLQVPPTGLTLQLIYQRGTAPFFQVGDQDHTLYLKILYDF